MSQVKATYSGFVGLEGVPVLLHEGEEYDSEHPLVLARPDLFTEPRRQAARPAAPRGKSKDNDG